MEASWIIFRRRHFHDATEFSAVFTAETGGHYAHGFAIARFDRRSKTGRAIFSQRQAVHDKLDVVLRAAWVQDAVGLLQPTRLGIDNIDDSAPALRRGLLT